MASALRGPNPRVRSGGKAQRTGRRRLRQSTGSPTYLNLCNRCQFSRPEQASGRLTASWCFRNKQRQHPGRDSCGLASSEGQAGPAAGPSLARQAARVQGTTSTASNGPSGGQIMLIAKRLKNYTGYVTTKSRDRGVAIGESRYGLSYRVIPRPGGNRSPVRGQPGRAYGPLATSTTRAAGPRRGNWIAFIYCFPVPYVRSSAVYGVLPTSTETRAIRAGSPR